MVSLHQHPPALNDLKAKQGRCVIQDHHVHRPAAQLFQRRRYLQTGIKGRRPIGVAGQQQRHIHVA